MVDKNGQRIGNYQSSSLNKKKRRNIISTTTFAAVNSINYIKQLECVGRLKKNSISDPIMKKLLKIATINWGKVLGDLTSYIAKVFTKMFSY